jgi:hypothetical protein
VLGGTPRGSVFFVVNAEPAAFFEGFDGCGVFLIVQPQRDAEPALVNVDVGRLEDLAVHAVDMRKGIVQWEIHHIPPGADMPQ